MSEYLGEIKEVHLNKVLEGKEEGDLSEYAKTLEGFFNTMMEVERDGFEENT